jgi:bifunctional DNA-binding transcriptional regulator/antitoxin component of YhaV-PrlF toxin-antitoxin module
MTYSKISKGGQVSVPAEVRRRWKTSRVQLVDLGDSLVIRPLPDDPIAALRGAFADTDGPSSEELRRAARAEQSAAEARRA